MVAPSTLVGLGILAAALLAAQEATASARIGGDPPGSRRVRVEFDIIYTDPDSINEIARSRGATVQAESFYYGAGNEIWVPFPDPKGGLFQKAYFLAGYEVANRALGPSHDTAYQAGVQTLDQQIAAMQAASQDVVYMP